MLSQASVRDFVPRDRYRHARALDTNLHTLGVPYGVAKLYLCLQQTDALGVITLLVLVTLWRFTGSSYGLIAGLYSSCTLQVHAS